MDPNPIYFHIFDMEEFIYNMALSPRGPTKMCHRKSLRDSKRKENKTTSELG